MGLVWGQRKVPMTQRASPVFTGFCHFSPSPLTKSRDGASLRHLSLAPAEGRQANGKRAEVHTPPPNPSAWLPGGGSIAQGNRRPRAGCLLPHGTGPTPNPSGAPAPTHPGAGVGGCRVGSRSNRRGSSAPRTSWLQKARSRPSYLPRSQPGPRARRPARARKLQPGAGGRGGAERPAARGSAQQPPLARLLLASEVSLAASLARSVRASVRPWGPPSPAATAAATAAAAAAAASAAPAPARQRVPSPPRRSARGLAGSLARSLPPPLPAPRRAEPGRPRAASLEVPFPRGEVVGARRRRGGEERRVRGRRQGCALGSLPIPAGPAAPGRAGERRAGESRAARQRRKRGGGPGVSPREGAQGEGVRGGVTPRARVCKSVSACVCVCVCGEGRARERGVGKRGRAWCVFPGEWRNPRVCLEVAECTDAGVSACASEGGHGGSSTCLRPSPATWQGGAPYRASFAAGPRLSAPSAEAEEVPRGHTTSNPTYEPLSSRRTKTPSEGRDSPSCSATSTHYPDRESGLESVNSHPSRSPSNGSPPSSSVPP
ncbi:uncharacterized protein [Chlorocebus sabaeus]|uniref:uncharacterized protein n=1 Tax=Chlorocebus sabaeus TaxID=60711 RepID=UPI003BF9710A